MKKSLLISFTLAKNIVASHRVLRMLGVVAIVSCFSPSARAITTDTWSGASSADWNTSGNWSAGIPSSTSNATFSNNVNTNVTLSAASNAASISFTGAGTGAFTIGTTGGNSLTLATNGSISTVSTVANPETVNAPLIIGGAAASAYSFSSGATPTADVLDIGGSVTGAAATGTTTLTLTGTNTGANTVSGVVGDGSGGGNLAITKSGAGTWILSGANTYSGTTSVNAGILNITGTNASAGATTLTGGTLELSNTTANDGGLASGLLSLAGTLNVNSAAALALSNTVSLTGALTVSGAESLTLNGATTLTASEIIANNLTGGGTLTLGAVNLGTASSSGFTLTVAGTTNTTISGAIEDYSGGVGSSGGKIVTYGADALTLSGNNTFSGGVSIGSGSSGGNLDIDSATALGTGTFNTNAIATGSAVSSFDNTSSGALTLTTNNVITLNSVTFGGTHTLTFGNGAINFTGPRTITLQGTGNLIFGGVLTNTGSGPGYPITVNATNSNYVSFAGVALGNSSTATGKAGGFSGNGEVVVTGAVTDGGSSNPVGFNYTGTGLLNLQSAASTYSGPTTIASGTVEVAGSSTIASGVITSGPLGTGSLTMDPTATLEDNGSAVTLANSFTTSATAGTITFGSTGSGSITFDGTALTTPAKFVLAASDIFAVNNTTTINDVVSGTKSLVKSGTGTLVMGGQNTYSGGTTISAGTLAAAVSNTGTTSGAFGPSADGVTLNDVNTGASNASLMINTAGVTVSNAITVANQGTGTDTIGGSNTSGTATYSGAVTMNKAVTLSAATGGTTEFSGSINFQNATSALTIGSTGNAGKVQVDTAFNTDGASVTVANGNLALNAAYTGGSMAVNGGGVTTLSGTGSVAGAVTVSNGSHLAPGANTSGPNGNFGSAATLAVGSTGGLVLGTANLDFDLSSSAASGNDLITTNSLNLTGAVLTLNINGLNGTLQTNTAYQLIDTTTGVTGLPTSIMTDLMGPLAGEYTETYSVKNGDYDVTFQLAVVPEPSTWAMMLSGIGALLFWQRRASRRS
jgi:fibronectin-binding autotransporter adhesin